MNGQARVGYSIKIQIPTVVDQILVQQGKYTNTVYCK